MQPSPISTPPASSHRVEVLADSLYEAGLRAIAAFRQMPMPDQLAPPAGDAAADRDPPALVLQPGGTRRAAIERR